ncbi:MAG: ABC transporter permease [Anaerobutyricum sp.]|nr:ABC transporter permease [Anaerobutyricum sp.]
MIRQAVKMAVKSIYLQKMRSFLTMLGVIIGVVALVVLVSVVNGATGSITDSINSIGTNMLNVIIKDDYDKPVKLSDLSLFTEEKSIEAVAPVLQTSLTASSDYATKTISITGTTSAYDDIRGITLSSGRFLMNADVENHSDVIVINSDLANDILGRNNVVGEKIKINGKQFLIIGTFSENSSLNNNTTNYLAYIPYTSYIRLTEGYGMDISSFCVSASDENTDAAENALSKILLNRFNQDEDAFTIVNQSAVAQAMSSVTDTLSLVLGGVAGISLLVGGIGIMNIMLVSVTERTKEIGIRKAIGAGRGNILMQFLVESLVLSLTGCVIGIFLSWCILMIINMIGNVSYELSSGIVLVSILFSMGIGVIFGLYPANRAAKMKPIDALRQNE